jgi:hypothetical protein
VFALLLSIEQLLPLLKCGATYLQHVCNAVDDLQLLPARDLIHQILGLVAGLEAIGPMRNHNVISTKAMQTIASYVKTSETVKTLKQLRPMGNNKYPEAEVNKAASEFPSHVVRGVIVQDTPAIPGKKKPQIPYKELSEDVQQLIQEAHGKPAAVVVSHSINTSRCVLFVRFFCSI